jgi:riboflavin synthase
MRSDPSGAVMRISVPDDLAHQIVMKGSVAVDGVSLTVSDVAKGEFSVSLIPHTLEITTLGLRRAGDAVNLETDMIAKYVARALEAVQ